MQQKLNWKLANFTSFFPKINLESWGCGLSTYVNSKLCFSFLKGKKKCNFWRLRDKLEINVLTAKFQEASRCAWDSFRLFMLLARDMWHSTTAQSSCLLYKVPFLIVFFLSVKFLESPYFTIQLNMYLGIWSCIF